MKKVKALVLLILFLLSINTYSCDCKEFGSLDKLRQVGYESSSNVFLGELIEIDTINFSFTFKIIEQFKGDYKSTIISGKSFDSCSKFPQHKGRWIIYADLENDCFINISQCLGSRSELDPICINCYQIPPPPPENYTDKEKLELDKTFKLFKEKAKEDWYSEIEWLRNMALSKSDL